jgi:hypothetical protein
VDTLEHERDALALVRAQRDADEIVDDDRVRPTAGRAARAHARARARARARALCVRRLRVRVAVAVRLVEDEPLVPLWQRGLERRVVPPERARVVDVDDVLRGDRELGRNRRLLKRRSARALAALAPQIEVHARVAPRDARGQREWTEARLAALRRREEGEHRRVLHADVALEQLTKIQGRLRRGLLSRGVDGHDVIVAVRRVDAGLLRVGHGGKGERVRETNCRKFSHATLASSPSPSRALCSTPI